MSFHYSHGSVFVCCMHSTCCFCFLRFTVLTSDYLKNRTEFTVQRSPGGDVCVTL